MARRAFFSFHYQRDIFRVNIVRNSNLIAGAAAAGWHDASLWERAKTTGPDAIRKLIDAGLERTTATVVCIGAQSANRQWIDYEIDQSVARGNKLLGVRIHHLAAPPTNVADRPGATPARLTKFGTKIIDFSTAAKLGEEIEQLFRLRWI
jgi:hypothetical protein